MTSVADITRASVPQIQTLALIKRSDVESYELERVLLREPQEDEVVIRVDAVALCGSDIAQYKWNDFAKVFINSYASVWLSFF